MEYNFRANVKKGEFKQFNKIQPRKGKKVKTDKVKMFTIDQFLNRNECRRLMKIIDADNDPSITLGANNNYRTSRTCWFNNLNKDDQSFLDKIDKRICNSLGIEIKRSEKLQGQVYQKGNEFKLHHDYFYPQHDISQTDIDNQGQRTWTFMVYLNDVKKGGITEFPHLSKKFKPKQGSVLTWNNLTPDGEHNTNTMHSGNPIEKGKKYIITKWFRTRGQLNTRFKKQTHKN